MLDFRSRIALHGLDGLLKPAEQDDPKPQAQFNDVSSFYAPSTTYVESFGKEIVDFRQGAAPYGTYNWELFFHAPFLIANRLSQRGAIARRASGTT